jgi:hypothetical protein
VQLKDILCQIDSNADKLHGGLLLPNRFCGDSSLALTCPQGEEESIPLLRVDSGRLNRAKEPAGCVELYYCNPEVCGD